MICLGGFSGLDTRAAFIAALALGLPVTLAVQGVTQERPVLLAQNDKAVKIDALKQRDQDLKAARDAHSKSIETEAAIKREIEQIGADRRKLNQDLIDTAGRIRGVEAQVAATETRLKSLDGNELGIRKSLEGRRAVIGEVLAALQRIGHHPPPALIASPEDALQSVRTAMLLGAVLPEMRHEVEALANDLTNLLDVRKKIAGERDRLKTEVASLGDERTRMTALVGERQKQQAERQPIGPSGR
jgi:septal ring factor EnvC (AmiA/AmiB activator)